MISMEDSNTNLDNIFYSKTISLGDFVETVDWDSNKFIKFYYNANFVPVKSDSEIDEFVSVMKHLYEQDHSLLPVSPKIVEDHIIGSYNSLIRFDNDYRLSRVIKGLTPDKTKGAKGRKSIIVDLIGDLIPSSILISVVLPDVSLLQSMDKAISWISKWHPHFPEYKKWLVNADEAKKQLPYEMLSLVLVTSLVRNLDDEQTSELIEASKKALLWTQDHPDLRPMMVEDVHCRIEEIQSEIIKNTPKAMDRRFEQVSDLLDKIENKSSSKSDIERLADKTQEDFIKSLPVKDLALSSSMMIVFPWKNMFEHEIDYRQFKQIERECQNYLLDDIFLIMPAEQYVEYLKTLDDEKTNELTLQRLVLAMDDFVDRYDLNIAYPEALFFALMSEQINGIICDNRLMSNLSQSIIDLRNKEISSEIIYTPNTDALLDFPRLTTSETDLFDALIRILDTPSLHAQLKSILLDALNIKLKDFPKWSRDETVSAFLGNALFSLDSDSSIGQLALQAVQFLILFLDHREIVFSSPFFFSALSFIYDTSMCLKQHKDEDLEDEATQFRNDLYLISTKLAESESTSFSSFYNYSFPTFGLSDYALLPLIANSTNMVSYIYSLLNCEDGAVKECLKLFPDPKARLTFYRVCLSLFEDENRITIDEFRTHVRSSKDDQQPEDSAELLSLKEKNDEKDLEIIRLKRKIDELEQVNSQAFNAGKRSLNADIQALKKENRELASRLEESETASNELYKLRSKVFEFSDDNQPKVVSQAMSEADLSRSASLMDTNRILIVGGHYDLHAELKKLYPSLTIVTSVNFSFKNLGRKDYCFFMTKFISHSLYFKALDYVKNENIPYDFINVKNLEQVQRIMLDSLEKADFKL